MLDERFTHCLARNLSPEPPHLAMGARNKGGMCNLTLDLSAKVMAGTWLDVREGGMTEPAAQRVIRRVPGPGEINPIIHFHLDLKHFSLNCNSHLLPSNHEFTHISTK